jgi:hypothetical protein
MVCGELVNARGEIDLSGTKRKLRTVTAFAFAVTAAMIAIGGCGDDAT